MRLSRKAGVVSWLKGWRPHGLIAIAFGLLTIGMATSVEATLLKRDFQNPGDGLLVRDDVTGLEWLTPLFTRGKSYNDIVGGSGGLLTPHGFRYGTRNEVLGMINSNFNNPPATHPGTVAGFDSAKNFFNVFGINLNLSCSSGGPIFPCPRTQGLVSDAGTFANSHQALGIIRFGSTGYLIDNPTGWSASSSDFQLGHWLVRNFKPTANAGDDQSVTEGTPVQLDASASVDPQGQPLSFAWQQLAGADRVTLDDATSSTPQFIAPYVSANTVLTFELVVTNKDDNYSTDIVNITVVQANTPPVADAGNNGTIKEGTTKVLDGSHSYDPDNEPIVSYLWTQVSGPAVLLSNPTVVNPSFAAPVGLGVPLVFVLQASDGKEWSLPDTVTITVVENSAPVANAGAEQTKNEGSAVSLDGTLSSDPDGDTLSYEWRQIGGTPVTLVNHLSAVASFTAPLVSVGGETLTFELMVSDNDSVHPKSGAAQTVVYVRSINDPPSCHLAQPSIATLWPPNHKMIPVGINGVIDTDSLYNTITLQITGVTQDEPVNGLGDGNTSLDAVIQPGTLADKVLLRAERSGTGNGRVYHVHFTATDGFESCEGAVKVSVPPNRNTAAVDDGQSVNAMQP